MIKPPSRIGWSSEGGSIRNLVPRFSPAPLPQERPWERGCSMYADRFAWQPGLMTYCCLSLSKSELWINQSNLFATCLHCISIFLPRWQEISASSRFPLPFKRQMVVSQTLLLAVMSARRLPGASSSVVSVWNFPTTSDPPPQAPWGIEYQLARAPGSFFDALSRRTVDGALLRMSVLLHSNLAISNSVNS